MDFKNQIIRQSSVLMILRLFVLTIIFNSFALVISLISDYYDTCNTGKFLSLIADDTLAFIFLIIIQFLIGLYLILRWYKEYYIIYDDFILHKWGIILKGEERINLTNARSVNYHQTFMGLLFHYGIIDITHIEKQKTNSIYGIDNPKYFIHLIEQKGQKK